MRLLVTRPHPDAERQAKRLRALRHEAVVEPLIEIVFRDAGRLSLEGVQALVATSRNGLRALARSEGLPRALELPFFAVGPATAGMAESLGFRDIHLGPGRADGMDRLIAGNCRPEAGAILHLAGRRLAADLKGDLKSRGFTVRQPRLYDSVRAPELSGALIEALSGGALDGVLLMSPFTARSWAELVRAAGVSGNAAKLRHFCLSHAVADALGALQPERVAIAESPGEDDLLALIARETAD